MQFKILSFDTQFKNVKLSLHTEEMQAFSIVNALQYSLLANTVKILPHMANVLMYFRI